MGSRSCSLRYWAHTPHDNQVSKIAACIPGQFNVSCAPRMLLSAPWCVCMSFVTFRVAERQVVSLDEANKGLTIN